MMLGGAQDNKLLQGANSCSMKKQLSCFIEYLQAKTQRRPPIIASNQAHDTQKHWTQILMLPDNDVDLLIIFTKPFGL